MNDEGIIMQAQINALTIRMQTMETLQSTHMAQTDAVKRDTSELLETFAALKGAWAVLNFIGKLAKPVTFISSLIAGYYIYTKK